MQLRHFVWVVRRWLWLIVLGTVVCAAATYVVSKKTHPVYEASALIQVNQGEPSTSSNVFNNQALAVSYAVQITNADVLREVSRELPNVGMGALQAAVSAAPVNNSEIIAVRADAPSPRQAANIANAVTRAFIQQQDTRELAREAAVARTLFNDVIKARANVDTAQARLSKLDDIHAPQDQIARQTDLRDAYEVNYNTLFTNYTQLELQQSMIANGLVISQVATPPPAPKGHKASFNAALAAALGLVLTIFCALLLDWIDTTIKTPDDVAQLAHLEPLGSVPLLRGPADKTPGSDPVLEQAFVTISTGFRALLGSRRAILISGLHQGAGVSLTASWLSSALAQSGLRVLLVDAHLQRPTQHITFNVSNTTGALESLSQPDALQPEAGAKQAWLHQWRTDIPNLFVLPAGPVPPQSQTIRRATLLRELTDWLLQPSGTPAESAIDLVLFDAPALAEGADTIALGTITDGTLLVLDAGRERADAVTKAQATLQRLGSPILGVVVNRQKPHQRPYFYADRPPFTPSIAVSEAKYLAAPSPAPSSQAPWPQMSPAITSSMEHPHAAPSMMVSPSSPPAPPRSGARARRHPDTAPVSSPLSPPNGFRPGDDLPG